MGGRGGAAAGAPLPTGSHRTTCRRFQGELPVDRSIWESLTYRTLLARWELERDTCGSGSSVSPIGRSRGDRARQGHLEDAPAARVQDPDPPVPAGGRQPAAVGAEADGQQQRLGRVALVDGPQKHPHRTPQDGAGLGHVPEEHLRGGATGWKQGPPAQPPPDPGA